MKRTGLIFQIVLALAVVALFVLHFTGKSGSHSSSSANDTSTLKIAAGSIVYVNIDTVFAQYQMTKDLSAEFQDKGKKIDTELQTKSKSLQQNYQDLQYKAQRGLEIRSKLEEMGQQLQLEEQNLYKLRDTYGAQLQEENAVMMRKIMNSIMEYMKEYNKEKNYSFIMGNTFDGKILYADNKLDITADVIKGLNEKYKSTKPAEKK